MFTFVVFSSKDSNTDDKDSGFDGREEHEEEEIAESSTSSDSSSDSESSSNSTSTMSEEDEEDIAKNGDLLGSDGRKMLHVTTSKPICNDQSKYFEYRELGNVIISLSFGKLETKCIFWSHPITNLKILNKLKNIMSTRYNSDF